ncbi:cyanophycinase [Pseudoduganella sp.]|uniref:cyanophycinase n=1 Tax=Pseudoduganella sp. TaxID=1880898 RepID=UPI0035B373F8
MRRQFLKAAGALLAAAALPRASAQAARAATGGAAGAVPAGALVIIGGALRPDTADVWQRIVALAGGPGARIAVLPSAAARPERSGASIAANLKRHGADAFVVPVAVRLAGSDYRARADDAELAESVRSAGGVYFSGGDQALVTQALVRPDGSRSAMLQAVWDVYQRGGVIAGTSAGAAIMSSTMFHDPRPTLAMLQHGVTPGRDLAPGLGFIGDQVFIDQHFLVRGRFARMLPAMQHAGYRLGLGIDENTAVVVRAQRELEVVGYKGVLLADLTQASSAPGPFNVSNARLSYLDRGDRYDLASGRHTPAPDKVNGRIDPARPALRGPVYANDVLANNAIVELMERLMDGDQREALGIAAGDPRTAPPQPAFHFRLSRDAASVGYASDVAEAYSLLNVRLDAAPAAQGAANR